MKETDENRKGFRVPEAYFESLDIRLMTRLKADSKKGLKVLDFCMYPPMKSMALWRITKACSQKTPLMRQTVRIALPKLLQT